jgi:hypothetical protein
VSIKPLGASCVEIAAGVPMGTGKSRDEPGGGGGGGSFANTARTALPTFSLTEQAPRPPHAPRQPLNAQPEAGCAVSRTRLFAVKPTAS